MSTSRSLNKVMLIGNLTRDPEVRKTENGSVVCTFGLATNTSWRDGAGNVQERTEYHNIVSWNKLAEICAELLSVSMAVFIEGELRTRTWIDANGSRQYKTEIKALDMKLLDNKDKQGVGLSEAMQDDSSSASSSSSSDDTDSDDNSDDSDAESDTDNEQSGFVEANPDDSDAGSTDSDDTDEAADKLKGEDLF